MPQHKWLKFEIPMTVTRTISKSPRSPLSQEFMLLLEEHSEVDLDSDIDVW